MKTPILAVLAMMIAASATAEDLTALEAEQAAYVDPVSKRDRFCPEHPYRPGWVMVQPFGYTWKGRLWERYYYLTAMQNVVESGECSCDLMFPSWDEMRPELEQIATEWPDVAGPEMTEDQSLLVSDIGRTYTQERSKISHEYRQLCAAIIRGDN